MIKRLIVAGIGELGRSIVHTLQVHYEIIAIDVRNEIILDLSGKYDIQGITGNILDTAILSDLKLDQKCALISVTGEDSINLTVCRYVRDHFSLGFIALRLKDLSIYQIIQSDHLKEGIHLVLNPEFNTINNAIYRLYYPNIMRHMSFFEKKLHGIILRINEQHHLCGMKIEEIERYQLQDVKVVQIFRNNKLEEIHKNTVIKKNDRVCIIYTPVSVLKKFLEITVSEPKFVVSFGINSFSYALTQTIQEHYPFLNIFFVDIDPFKYHELATRYPKFSFYSSNFLDESLWTDLNIRPKEAGILALGLNDADNLLSGLVHQSAHQVITVLQDASYIPVGLKIGARSIIHPNALILEQLMTHLSPSYIQRIHILMDSHSDSTEPILFVTALIVEESDLLKISYDTLKALNIKVLAILRKNKIFSTSEFFLKNDQVLFLCLQSNYAQILNLLKK
ncbi:Trk system potassium uptake protein TrkA [Holospora obtusa F1]|uniref:Trk system potassium uptake protein TrkA n=1 Tax=Holospora obtusa F1 TaxID=1399147 RepID=W6TDF2_HOLOB|nr:NAD-binding protein [Holospora obtusa]ETZ06776.1 Trk system potassium uptake protein TrkA [Holospora obtusa F1]